MSSIKKYVGGDTKEWLKFGETNVLPNEISSARNISVDFGDCNSVNSLLYSQQQDIEKLKRNVSWLALHGGGGSGGSGGGTVSRKASCTILINGIASEVAVTEGQTTYVTLSDFKGSGTTVPWKVSITFDGSAIYSGSKSQGSLDAITIPISWSSISRFFDGTGKTKNHLMSVLATYSDEETSLTGSVQLDSYVYIPTITCVFTAKDSYNTDNVTELTASIAIDTALMGTFKMKVTSTSYNREIVYDSFEFNKTTDSAVFTIDNFMDAFKEDGKIQLGVYSSLIQLYHEDSSTGQLQLAYQTTKQIIIYSNTVDLLVNFSGLSPLSADKSRTEVYDNVKNVLFQFYAFKNGATEYEYSVILKDETDTSKEDITVVPSKAGVFGATVTINKIVNELISTHRYTVVLSITPTKPSGDTGQFLGYIKCIKGQFSFITYSGDGEKNRLFSVDPFNSVINDNGLSTTLMVTSNTSDASYIGENHQVSAYLHFSQINPRSGLIADDDNVKAIRLFDTYLDIDNSFKFTNKIGDETIVTTTHIQDHKQFTICICYQTQTYTSNDHVVFALCNRGFENQGIVIKNDGIYVKGSKVLTVYGDRLVTVHIVYDNDSGTSTTNWGSSSCYKIYVNGVITYISDKCPFVEQSVEEGGVSILSVQNEYLSASMNGFTQWGTAERQQQCNCDIFDVEIMKGVMNEIDILASYVNNKVRTTYKDLSPDFSIVSEEMAKNCCTYNAADNTITSDMYPTTGAERKFVFTNVLLDSLGEVPHASTTEEKEKWISKLSSLSLPITYIDIKDSQSKTASDWTFENFKKKGNYLEDNIVTTKFYYWDPTTGEMPISSDSVDLNIQGTSTKEDYIKNVEIKFSESEKSGTIVQDLLFVRNDWIPENSYVLKADMVDSSHANNASIGKFINEHFKKNNGFGFEFDEKGIASTNITQTTAVLSGAQGWNIEPQLKHTVEGFQTLLLIRFYNTDFINLGIYSFNIGRNAARNLGFEYITGVTNISGETITNLAAPVILKDVIVNTMNENEVFWIENSQTQNFAGISAWTPTTNSITPDAEGTKTGSNPDYECRFWHCRQGTIEEDTKLNQLFETKYYNTLAKVYPASITTFNNFVTQVSKLPVEGLLKTTALDHTVPQIVGGYTTYKYNAALSGWVRLSDPHTLNAEKLEDADVNSFDPIQIASYYIIALMFGLIDNLDKNISFRVFGESKILADFYDMDTALGLNNAGLEDVSPTVGAKLVSNYRNTLDQDYPFETFNTSIVQSMYPKYNKLLPETYTNKLWLSLDSNSMRTFNGISYSLYSSLWFKLRQYLDKAAADAGFSNIVDFFVDKYFGAQVNCGTFIYNYDYTMKYLNDYYQTGKKQSLNTISKLHGRRIDEVRAWLKNHIDFLDSYFYWRGHYTYIDGSKVVPEGLNSVVINKVSITSSSSNNQIEIETEHPVIVHESSTADGDNVGDTLTVDDQPKNIKVPGGSTDKQMSLNCCSLLKNFDLVSLGAKAFRAQDGSKITFLEELILDGLNIIADGISMSDFIDSSSSDINVLSKISMRGTKFSQSFDLNLDDFRFLNVSYVDIKNSENVNSLTFYSRSEDSTTQNLKYLDVAGSSIENLTLKNQSYLVLPNINTCTHLATLTLKDCNLDNIGGSRYALSNYMHISLSGQTTLKSVNIQNVEHIKDISIKSCQSFESMTLKNVSALTSLTLAYDPSLKSLEIYNCPALQDIKITHCYSFNDLDILSVNNLTNLNLEYDYSLSSLRASEGSVSAIQTLNIRNVNISGIGYYNEANQSFDDIIEDPRGNKVLDLKPFKSLNSDGLTIRRYSSGDYTSDKCSNFLAIRFPNDPAKAYQILDRNRDDVGVRFTNLKNIYGHVKTQSNCEWTSGEQLFLDDGDTYQGYPPFLSVFMSNGSVKVDKSLLKTNTFFDLIEEKCSTMKSVLSGRNDLSVAESYIVNGFLSCSADNLNEFDTREWATNYTVPTLYFVCESKGSLDQYWLQYLMYRYSISQRANQISKTKSNIHGLGYYFPSGAGTTISFPNNTFKFFGNTMDDIRMVFRSLPTGYKYSITYDLMKWIPDMKVYAGLANSEILYWNALSSCSQLTTIGNYDDGNYYTSTAVVALTGNDGAIDYGPAFISTLTSLKQINFFSPATTNFYLSGCQLPSGLTTLGNSFTKFDSSHIVDISSLIGNCASLHNLYGSLNTSKLIIKPTAFKNNTQLKRLEFNDSTKYLVEDRISLSNFLCSYVDGSSRYQIRDSYDSEDPEVYTSYTQSMFTEFVNNVFSSNVELTSTNLALANMYLPYYNVQEGDYADLQLNANLLKNNPKIQSLQNFMRNVYFRYTLVPELFKNLSAITNMYGAFQNTASTSRGIASSIPARFFYTGDSTPAILTCRGTDRFDKYVASYSDFKTNIKNSYVPTTSKAGSTSYSWDVLSSGLDSIGLLNLEAFNDVSSTYLTGDSGTYGYVYIPSQLTDYVDKCPLVSNLLSDDGVTVYQQVTPGAEPLVNTLSSLNQKLSSNASGWETHVCGLSTTTLTYPTFRKTIANVNYCFAGNCNIKPYDGEISAENNAEYNPFFLNYTADRQSFSTNVDRNVFKLDDQWSSNGAIWKWSDVIDDWEINISNYNANHNNSTTPDLSVLSSNSFTVKDLSGTGAEILYENVDSYKQTYFYDDSKNQKLLVEYLLTKDQVQEFKYICAPDLFRYCNGGMQTLNYVFASCDNFCNGVSYSTNKLSANTGITGRIPPNLLKPLASLKDITGLFKKCSHMTGYQGVGSDGGIHSYLIPSDLFSNSTGIYNFNEAFLGTAIKYRPDFELPFASIIAGSSSNSTKLQINSTFAYCIWCYVNTIITNMLTGKYFSNINYAFKCTSGTGTRSVGSTAITNSGTLVGNTPSFNVFRAIKYVPSAITQTYYGPSVFSVQSTDVARNTATTDATVKPVSPA